MATSALTDALGSPIAADVAPLPELAAVHWRPRVDERRLRRYERAWTVSTLAHTIPFMVASVLLVVLQPLSFPVAVIALAHAWVIPELYAQRGANVVRARRRAAPPPSLSHPTPTERVALGLLGDLVGHRACELHARSGLILERGRLGVWLVGDAGALLVRPGGRRVLCYCVRAVDATLPSGDRIAHLLLALRADETGFATVANMAFSGARWRVRRRLPADARVALDEAAAVAAAAQR